MTKRSEFKASLESVLTNYAVYPRVHNGMVLFSSPDFILSNH